MSFLEEYKALDAICKDMLSREKGVSSYIEEMERCQPYAGDISGWIDDYKKLKHYRWLRNQIAHEPGKSEANSTTTKDTEWLSNFHKRILKQKDPLALYRQARKKRNIHTGNGNSARKRSAQMKDETMGVGGVLAAVLIALAMLTALAAFWGA